MRLRARGRFDEESRGWYELSMITRGVGRRVSSLVHRPIQRLEFIRSPSSIVLALQISAKRKLSPPMLIASWPT